MVLFSNLSCVCQLGHPCRQTDSKQTDTHTRMKIYFPVIFSDTCSNVLKILKEIKMSFILIFIQLIVNCYYNRSNICESFFLWSGSGDKITLDELLGEEAILLSLLNVMFKILSPAGDILIKFFGDITW